jgi:outer membrane receptor protein involved in Fe transport
VDGGVRFPVPAFVSETDFRRGNLAASARWAPAASGFSLVAGVERQTEKGSLTSVGDFFGAGTPQTLTFALDRDTDSVFAEGQLKLSPAISVQLGVRHDKVQGLEAVTTPHLGLVWEVMPGSTLKFNANEGFKPPSFFALGFPIGGNPNLKPEKSRNAEASFTQRLDGAGSTAQVGVFETRYKDLVDFDGATFSNINRGTIVVRGVEPEVSLRMLPGWRFTAGAALLSIDVRDGLQTLRNRPEKTGHLSVQGDLGRIGGIFAGVRVSGGYLDRSNPTGDIQMPGYSVLDLAYTLSLGAWRGKLALDNVLDKNYEQFVGFPAQGRRLRAEVSASF